MTQSDPSVSLLLVSKLKDRRFLSTWLGIVGAAFVLEACRKLSLDRLPQGFEADPFLLALAVAALLFVGHRAHRAVIVSGLLMLLVLGALAQILNASFLQFMNVLRADLWSYVLLLTGPCLLSPAEWWAASRRRCHGVDQPRTTLSMQS